LANLARRRGIIVPSLSELGDPDALEHPVETESAPEPEAEPEPEPEPAEVSP